MIFTNWNLKIVLSYIKTGAAPVWLDSENYSSTFYLVTLSKKSDSGRKYWEQKNASWYPKKT